MKPRFPPRLQARGKCCARYGKKTKIHIIVRVLFSAGTAQRYNRVAVGNKCHRLALLRCLTVRIGGSNAGMLLMVNPNEPLIRPPDGL